MSRPGSPQPSRRGGEKERKEKRATGHVGSTPCPSLLAGATQSLAAERQASSEKRACEKRELVYPLSARAEFAGFNMAAGRRDVR